MALRAEDEILQDFLLEASEIVEQLGEQLVGLEKTPEDDELLNAIFRGFHTVKGGAGFLTITPLVDTCHRAEDVFNVLRQGRRRVTPPLMDTILQALDAVNEMMDQLRDGEMLGVESVRTTIRKEHARHTDPARITPGQQRRP